MIKEPLQLEYLKLAGVSESSKIGSVPYAIQNHFGHMDVLQGKAIASANDTVVGTDQAASLMGNILKFLYHQDISIKDPQPNILYPKQSIIRWIGRFLLCLLSYIEGIRQGFHSVRLSP